MALSGSLTAAYRVVGLRRTTNITYCAYVQHRFRSYPRRHGNGPTVKAVFDDDGNKIDVGKLSQLKNEIEQNSADFGRKPKNKDFQTMEKADFGRKPTNKDVQTMEGLKKYSMSNFPIKPKKSNGFGSTFKNTEAEQSSKSNRNRDQRPPTFKNTEAEQSSRSDRHRDQRPPTFKNTEAEQSSSSNRRSDQNPSSDSIESDEKDKEYAGKVPHYTKIGGWDKSNNELKTLGKILTSRQARENSDTVVLEGTRIIRDAVSAGFVPKVVVFSRIKLLHTLDLDKSNNSTKFYHVPYTNIELWTDLSTSPGVMAAFSKEEIMEGVVADSPLPFSLVCDNVRSPDNLGAVIRCAAAAGVGRIFVTKGCVDVWNSKVVRAAAGAHFLVPIVQDVGWDQINGYLPPYPQVLLADLVHTKAEDRELVQLMLDDLEAECSEEGFQAHEPGEDGVKRDISYLDEELCERYKEIPLKTTAYSEFEMRPGVKEGVIVVGGETEGVSGAAYKYCHSHDGERIFVPLRNKVNSLNVISATSVVLYRLQQELLKQNP